MENYRSALHGEDTQWLGHTLRKHVGNITHSVLERTPQGNKIEGGPRQLTTILKEAGKLFNELRELARYRQYSKIFVDRLSF